MNKIQVLDLFSGIGGFSLGLERAGFETVAFCEIDKYCRLVLQKHWKDIKIYSDVREIKKERLEADGIPSPDVITGGFPCQPFSVAGRRQGTGDNRYLWPEMFRIIKEFKPRWIIAENVRGIINIQDGVVFEGVHADLESQNYETQTFIIPAAGVGAPHRRDRVWVVAHSKFNGFPSSKKRKSTKETIPKESQGQNNSFNTTGTSGLSSSTKIMANSRRTIRGEQSSRNKESIGSGTSQKTERTFDRDSITGSSEREKIMANSKRVYVQGQHDGSGKEQSRRGGWWEVEPNVGRVADGLPGRVHRLKGLGNSIVPQIAEEIGKAILKVDLIDRDSKA